MPVDITNLLARPLFLQTNSGANVRLSPGAVVRRVADVELQDNAKIQKLVDQHAIAVTTVGEAHSVRVPEREARKNEKPRKRR